MPRSNVPTPESASVAGGVPASPSSPAAPAASQSATGDGPAVNEADAQPDSLFGQLRRLYSAIAQEPIPESISSLLRRMRT